MSKASTLYQEMKSFNVRPVISLLKRERWLEDDDAISDAIDGLLQWFAGHAVYKHELPYVMMNGNVDKAFHAFILNTRLYADFCKKHVGFFINHTPLDAEDTNALVVMGGVDYTVNFLKDSFPYLSPALQEWVRKNDAGEFTISAVSCFGNGYDDIADFEDFSFRLGTKEAFFART